MKKAMIIYGTRPECIKIYPVIEALKSYKHIKIVLVNTGQQRELSDSFTKQFKLKPKYNLAIMKTYQSLNHIVSEVTKHLNTIIDNEKPDLVLIQGDTTTAMSSALAASNLKIPVGHIEAGLRTYDNYNPFPEEMNRKLISQLATYHFCPTEDNKANLWDCCHDDEGKVQAWVTGNTSIDVVKSIKPKLEGKTFRQILLTTHRRENLEGILSRAYYYIDSIDKFLNKKNGYCATLPQFKCKWITHPNSDLYVSLLKSRGLPYFECIEPLPYDKFINECYNSDLILSDSGGIQEEITIIKKPLFVLRETTERPEALELPFVKLVKDPLKLSGELERFFKTEPVDYSKNKYNILGKGDAGKRIAKIIANEILK